MPIITTDQKVTVEIEVEVYCNTCGCGLCGETTVKGHDFPQLKVNVCPDCIKKRDEEIEELNYDIKELNKSLKDKDYEIEILKDELNEINKTLKI